MERNNEVEMQSSLHTLSASLERIAAAVCALEISAARLEVYGGAQQGEVQKITAAIESGLLETGRLGPNEDALRRETELERRLAQAEETIAALQAGGARELAREENRASARKTLPAATVQLLAKQGIDTMDTVDVQTLDAALVGLSVEQRIAIKSQMMRTGTLTL